MRRTKRGLLRHAGTRIFSLFLCFSLLLLGAGSVYATVYNHHFYGEDWTWSPSAKSAEEAKANAIKVAEQIAAEGQVLLKNENSTLPLSGDEWLTVFSTTSTKRFLHFRYRGWRF